MNNGPFNQPLERGGETGRQPGGAGIKCAKPSEPGRARARLRAGDEDQPQTPRAGRGAGTCPCRARPSSALLSSRRPGPEAHAAATATCSPASRCGLPGAAGKLTRPTGSPAGLGVPSARTQGRQWLETLLRGPRPCWTDPCPFYPATRGLENADEAAPDNRGLFPCALRSGPLCAEAPTPTWGAGPTARGGGAGRTQRQPFLPHGQSFGAAATPRTPMGRASVTEGLTSPEPVRGRSA